jgi:hypothetical protein
VTPNPGISKTLGALRAFLLAILPDGVVVETAQQNRVPEPQEGSFVLMTPLRQDRIETNVDIFEDLVFTGSITGTAMTVTALDPNFDAPLAAGLTVFGASVATGTKIVDQQSGTPGGIGVYTVSASQNIPSQKYLGFGTYTREEGRGDIRER